MLSCSVLLLSRLPTEFDVATDVETPLEIARSDDAPVDVAAVEALIEERTQLRREHDYDAADAVRDRLKFDFDVTVHDRENEWFVGSGSFGRGGNFAPMRGGRGGDRGPPRGYSRDPYDNAEVDVAAVEALLEERSGYRAKRMWNEADAVRDRLRRRAAEHGHSMEEEVRQILRQVVKPVEPAASSEGLGSRIHNHFAQLGGIELELPPRSDTPSAPSLEP